jgi:pyridoxamine 5'-phosphate oxidase
MSQRISLSRFEYRAGTLNEADLHPNPLEQFSKWLNAALQASLPEPNAMTLATADDQGRPSARIVLLRGFDDQGFVFFTNYTSRKARELEANPWVALVFYWPELERQVRIEAHASRVTPAEADQYFNRRPRESQLGAWASPQSQPIPSRQALEDRLEHYRREFGETVPRPDTWGGYRARPHAFEFWQGRPGRLHDRFRYRRPDSDPAAPWIIERLAP